jgi:3-oxoisoapionate decarboxylase
MPTRREFVHSLVAAGVTPLGVPLLGSTAGTFGIVYTSYAVRMLQGRDIFKTTAEALPAAAFIDLCSKAGAAGCQMDLSQLPSIESAALHDVRRLVESRGLFLELSVGARHLESVEAYDAAARVAREIGVTRLRVALLSGRRYETFKSLDEWRRFAGMWRQRLVDVKPAIERHALLVGIENHKDFLGAELAELLRFLDSSYIGACVDFGNNLAMLEESELVVETLAPWVVTTHVKDMAVRANETGFELSEVPLGAGSLPLEKLIATLRRTRSDVHLCLEMITRDPLDVPFRQPGYWASRDGRDEAAVRRFASAVVERGWTKPLPRIKGLTAAQAVAAEDENVKQSVEFARTNLGLLPER